VATPVATPAAPIDYGTVDPNLPDCINFKTCSDCATQSHCGWCAIDAYGTCRSPAKTYLVISTNTELKGAEWCFASQGIFRWETCEPSNQEIANAFNSLSSGELSDQLGDQALSAGLADKFDIIISALLGANTSTDNTQFQLYVDLSGTEEPTPEDLLVVCKIVSFTLADQLKIDVDRITCNLEEEKEVRSNDNIRYLATMNVKPPETLKDNLTGTALSLRPSIAALFAFAFCTIWSLRRS